MERFIWEFSATLLPTATTGWIIITLNLTYILSLQPFTHGICLALHCFALLVPEVCIYVVWHLEYLALPVITGNLYLSKYPMLVRNNSLCPVWSFMTCSFQLDNTSFLRKWDCTTTGWIVITFEFTMLCLMYICCAAFGMPYIAGSVKPSSIAWWTMLDWFWAMVPNSKAPCQW